jgi:transcription initiation factor TFIIH subunit 4
MPAPQASSRRFSPTRLATTLTSSLPPLPTATSAGDAKDQGFIVLETNYRLYAYTGTPSPDARRKAWRVRPLTSSD